ncbi:hypothetical protein [Intestinirhabdus alba]|jgi:hypothetical protein|uniref:Inner membrane protein yidI n=1 Tax=Intestinirhabdus alba TaxID=2899544 RepID=A0A6L6IMV4_9ENTR|nr:hypothetical protein [Intestinirhabdus alba]MTH47839.1 hypothetical protein [Intestinirhabdus alba]
MEIITQNKWGSLGMLLGAIALITGILHMQLGPIAAPPPLESTVARQITAVKKGILAGLKGEKPTAAPARSAPINADRIVDNVSIALAVSALLCAFIGGMRKENNWSTSGALLFGGATLAFHAFMFVIAILCALALLMLIVTALTG